MQFIFNILTYGNIILDPQLPNTFKTFLKKGRSYDLIDYWYMQSLLKNIKLENELLKKSTVLKIILF